MLSGHGFEVLLFGVTCQAYQGLQVCDASLAALQTLAVVFMNTLVLDYLAVYYYQSELPEHEPVNE